MVYIFCPEPNPKKRPSCLNCNSRKMSHIFLQSVFSPHSVIANSGDCTTDFPGGSVRLSSLEAPGPPDIKPAARPVGKKPKHHSLQTLLWVLPSQTTELCVEAYPKFEGHFGGARFSLKHRYDPDSPCFKAP